jgi:flagellar hook-associated protein 1
MADLFALLVQSGNSLGAHSAALATAGHNIANANTPGYSRQVVNLAANAAAGSLGASAVGMGVSVETITRQRDAFVERQIPQALGAQSFSQTENAALQSITALNPDLEGGLGSALAAFYSSLRTLAQNAGDTAARQAVSGTSQSLARAFNQTVGSIEDARTGLDSQLLGQVDKVNASMRALADLNVQIQVLRSNGGAANDLLDQRQSAVEALSQLTGAQPYTNNAGDISMALPGGTVLVSDGRPATFAAVGDSTNLGHLKLTLVRTDGSGPVDVPSSVVGGEMGGVLAARDGAMKTAVNSLDTFAFDFATAVNTIHQAGYAMDGTGARSLFTVPVTSAGAATQIAVNAAIVADPRLLAAATTLPAASGDNRNVLALIAGERQALAGGSDPVVSFQKIVTGFGNATSQAKAMADHDGAMAAHLRQLRDATSGVSLDEEMVNLTKAQKAYEAMAKVISTADQMLDTLMKLR